MNPRKHSADHAYFDQAKHLCAQKKYLEAVELYEKEKDGDPVRRNLEIAYCLLKYLEVSGVDFDVYHKKVETILNSIQPIIESKSEKTKSFYYQLCSRNVEQYLRKSSHNRNSALQFDLRLKVIEFDLKSFNYTHSIFALTRIIRQYINLHDFQNARKYYDIGRKEFPQPLVEEDVENIFQGFESEINFALDIKKRKNLIEKAGNQLQTSNLTLEKLAALNQLQFYLKYLEKKSNNNDAETNAELLLLIIDKINSCTFDDHQLNELTTAQLFTLTMTFKAADPERALRFFEDVVAPMFSEGKNEVKLRYATILASAEYYEDCIQQCEEIDISECEPLLILDICKLKAYACAQIGDKEKERKAREMGQSIKQNNPTLQSLRAKNILSLQKRSLLYEENRHTDPLRDEHKHPARKENSKSVRCINVNDNNNNNNNAPCVVAHSESLKFSSKTANTSSSVTNTISFASVASFEKEKKPVPVKSSYAAMMKQPPKKIAPEPKPETTKPIVEVKKPVQVTHPTQAKPKRIRYEKAKFVTNAFPPASRAVSYKDWKRITIAKELNDVVDKAPLSGKEEEPLHPAAKQDPVPNLQKPAKTCSKIGLFAVGAVTAVVAGITAAIAYGYGK